MNYEQIKAVFLANGFSIKEGNDLRPYVYQAARALLAEATQNVVEGLPERSTERTTCGTFRSNHAVGWDDCLDAVTPLVAKLQAEIGTEKDRADVWKDKALELVKELDALRAEVERLKTENADLIEARDSRVTARLAVLDRQESEIDTLRTTNAELVGLLRDAVEDIESWAAYASMYFQGKHDLQGSLSRYRAALLASTGGGERG